MIKINNSSIISPNDYTVSIFDITKAERNSKGDMQIDLINKKFKVEVSWKILTQQEMTQILNALESSVTFKVEFLDPQTGSMITRDFYKGDRTIPIFDFKNGVARYKDFKISLIEV